MTKAQTKRLDEIKALRAAAKARGDWKAVHELDTDWSFVFRQILGGSFR